MPTEQQKKHLEQMKANREKIAERKTRTRRLIIRGAIAEKAFPNAEKMTDEEFECVLFRVVEAGNFYLNFQKDYDEKTSRESPPEG